MAVYGRDDPTLFRRAVDSAYGNTLPPDEFLLVVDGPVPAQLASLIRGYEAHRDLRALWLPDNVGLARALNEGLAAVRTEWVVRADADDVNLLDRFEKQALAVVRSGGELDLLGGAILEVDRSGAPIAVRDVPLDARDIARRLSMRSPFNHATVAYRTACVREAGGYPNLYLKEDYGLWAAMIARGARCKNIPEILVHVTGGRAMYRRRGGIKYAVSEWGLQLHLYRLRLSGLMSALAFGGLRALTACLPSGLRGKVYETLLRKPLA
jgi:glycosyltransferase involved in cell wall biosynthesis